MPSRSRSFGAVAAAYARHRPGYPAAAVDWALEPLAGRGELRLLDLGAGTGKLTDALVGRGAVTAVEPDPSMLAELRARHPEVDAREGSAEEVPVGDAAVDAVLVGQAFHWFAPDRALPEIARVLRPGGVLAALWNQGDTSVAWVAELVEVVSRERTAMAADTAPALPEHPAFDAAVTRTFPNPRRTTTDGLLATTATHSWALTITPEEREAAFARIRAVLAAHPETASGEFALPMVTDVLRAVRR